MSCDYAELDRGLDDQDLPIAQVGALAELDTVPMGADEARQALAAYRGLPDSPGGSLSAESPLNYWLQQIAFSLLGSGEATARLFTALGGALLGLSPLLFRDLLGRARAFLLR